MLKQRFSILLTAWAVHYDQLFCSFSRYIYFTIRKLQRQFLGIVKLGWVFLKLRPISSRVTTKHMFPIQSKLYFMKLIWVKWTCISSYSKEKVFSRWILEIRRLYSAEIVSSKFSENNYCFSFFTLCHLSPHPTQKIDFFDQNTIFHFRRRFVVQKVRFQNAYKFHEKCHSFLVL